MFSQWSNLNMVMHGHSDVHAVLLLKTLRSFCPSNSKSVNIIVDRSSEGRKYPLTGSSGGWGLWPGMPLRWPLFCPPPWSPQSFLGSRKVVAILIPSTLSCVFLYLRPGSRRAGGLRLGTQSACPPSPGEVLSPRGCSDQRRKHGVIKPISVFWVHDSKQSMDCAGVPCPDPVAARGKCGRCTR